MEPVVFFRLHTDCLIIAALCVYDNKNLENDQIKISHNGFSLWGSIWQRSEGQKDQNQLTQQTVAVKASVPC